MTALSSGMRLRHLLSFRRHRHARPGATIRGCPVRPVTTAISQHVDDGGRPYGPVTRCDVTIVALGDEPLHPE